VIRGPDEFDDGNYGEDEHDEWFEIMSDPEEDEGANLDVQEEYNEFDEDDEFQPEDDDLMGDIYG
jgi:hypothetical protein